MGIKRGAVITLLAATAIFGTLGVTTVNPASAAKGSVTGQVQSGICTSATHHRLAAWLSRRIDNALAGHHSVIGLAVADPRLGLTCGLHETAHFDAASTIKVTIISALLLEEHGPSGMTAQQRHLAWLMITESDNNAATALWNDVGMAHMQTFLNRAGMRHTVLSYAWGLTQETAQDELALLHVLTSQNNVLSGPSRRYVLFLMAHVIASERWGVPAGAPASLHVSVKNGWLPDPLTGAWHINSIGAFSGKDVGYRIAVLTSGNRSEDDGINTIQAAAIVINGALGH